VDHQKVYGRADSALAFFAYYLSLPDKDVLAAASEKLFCSDNFDPTNTNHVFSALAVGLGLGIGEGEASARLA